MFVRGFLISTLVVPVAVFECAVDLVVANFFVQKVCVADEIAHLILGAVAAVFGFAIHETTRNRITRSKASQNFISVQRFRRNCGRSRVLSLPLSLLGTKIQPLGKKRNTA